MIPRLRALGQSYRMSSSLMDLMRREAWESPSTFWDREAKNRVVWDKPWHTTLSLDKHGRGEWFAGGYLNTCYNAIDRHVEAGLSSKNAIIFDSPVTNTIRNISYGELLERVASFSGVLHGLGLRKGDTAVIYMPMIPEAAIAMLACARLGVIHSVVFGGFAPPQLASRIDDVTPKVIISASCGIEASRVIPYKPLVDQAIQLAKHKAPHSIIFQREQCIANLNRNYDIEWKESHNIFRNPHSCVSVESNHPLYVLYTSGTTGQPKGIVRENGGHSVALLFSTEYLYDIRKDDVWWAASDIGWILGHSYSVYAPLLQGSTTVFYEGKAVGTPDSGSFFRVIEQHQVNSMFVAPTAFRGIRQVDPDGHNIAKYNLSSLRSLFLAGERCDPETLEWVHHHVNVPVIDNWWQTELGWPVCINPRKPGFGVKIKPGSSALTVPGWKLDIILDDGSFANPNQMGDISLRLPLPPGASTTLWKNDERFRNVYLSKHKGYYDTADAGYKDEDGYVYIMTRTDDVINVAGHRLSTGEMEEVVAQHSDVVECAVVAVEDEIKGHVPLCFIVIKSSSITPKQLIQQQVVQNVRVKIGAVASLRRVIIVKRLPKTRSGKILRKIMAKIVDNQSFVVPPTIDDEEVLDEIRESVKHQQ